MTKKILTSTHDVGVSFLRTELQAGLTFASVASTTGRSDTRKRNRQNASTALQAVMKFRKRVPLSLAEKEEVENGLADLRLAIAAIRPHTGARRGD